VDPEFSQQISTGLEILQRQDIRSVSHTVAAVVACNIHILFQLFPLIKMACKIGKPLMDYATGCVPP